MEKKEILLEITDVLHQIGMPAHVKGYHYVREAILMVYFDSSLLDHMMGGVYRQLALRYNTSLQCVERVIRAAIEITWLRGNHEAIYKLFQNTVDGRKARPTNKEFIALLADYLTIKHL